MEEGCHSGIYKEVSYDYAMNAKENGAIISSSFVLWQEKEDSMKVIFTVNLSVQSKHWKKGSVRLDSQPEFALEI